MAPATTEKSIDNGFAAAKQLPRERIAGLEENALKPAKIRRRRHPYQELRCDYIYQ
jgi:hypothetical protein